MTGKRERPTITPELKVGELLEAYPELEDVLVDIAPAFEKLRNPVLRRTVAKLTSIRQAAQVGGVSLGEMVGRLRSAAGCEEGWVDEGVAPAETDVRPDWVNEGELVETFDAFEMIEGGGHPLPQVLAALRKLRPGQVYAIITPFVPAPMLDKAAEAGYRTWTERLGNERFKTHFTPGGE